jgi:hypothetical protein
MKSMVGACLPELAHRLARRLSKIMGHRSRYSSFGEDAPTSRQGEQLLRNYLYARAKVDAIECFNELRFRIAGSPGRLVVRCHDKFHDKTPTRAVLVRSPYGILHPSSSTAAACTFVPPSSPSLLSLGAHPITAPALISPGYTSFCLTYC